MWANQFIYISSDGSEGNPRIEYQFEAGKPLKLKTMVDRDQVKIFINGEKIHEFQMKGKLASSGSDNLVGLWGHRMMEMSGADFKVTTPGRLSIKRFINNFIFALIFFKLSSRTKLLQIFKIDNLNIANC